MPDDITVKNEFTLVPEGEYQGVLVDIVDMGLVHSDKWGKWQPKVAFVFQLDARDPKTGKRHELSARHTLNMSNKANLRKFLGQWRGKPYSDAEANRGVKLSAMVGANAVLTIVHSDGERVFANIFNIRKLGPNDPKITAENYVRSEYWAKRKAEDEAKAASADTPATQAARAQTPPQRATVPQGAGPGLTDHDVPPADGEFEDFPAALQEEEDDLPFKSAGGEKTCFKCSRTLPADSFYRHPMMGDGRLGKCKECTRQDVRENYAKKRERYHEYDRSRYRAGPARREGIEAYRLREPAKDKARQKLHTAVHAGRVQRQPCEECGNPKTDAHHDDYSKPLEVRWLCRTHHARLHGALRISA